MNELEAIIDNWERNSRQLGKYFVFFWTSEVPGLCGCPRSGYDIRITRVFLVSEISDPDPFIFRQFPRSEIRIRLSKKLDPHSPDRYVHISQANDRQYVWRRWWNNNTSILESLQTMRCCEIWARLASVISQPCPRWTRTNFSEPCVFLFKWLPGVHAPILQYVR